ncbi:MAG: Gluconokinase [Subtercola sp.]|nr:Gluconokinase [Subtercola sp.]
MKLTDTVIAIDISSSGVRARAHRRDLTVIAEHAVDLHTTVAADGASFHELPAIVEAVRSVVRLLADDPELNIVALVGSGTASSLVVAVLGSGEPRPVTEALLWSDSRSAPWFAAVSTELASAYERTLCPPDVSYWPSKLAMLRDRGALGSARVGSAKDFVFAWLTGELWTEPMSAASSGVFDSASWSWDRPLLELLGVEGALLPEVHAATESAPLCASAARELGLDLGIPVVLGGMDGPLTQLGAAGAASGVASCTIGTSIAFREASVRRSVDPDRRTWCYPVSPELWVIGGAGSNGGNILTWLRDRLGLAADVTTLADLAFGAPPDPELVFVPYLNGERAPLWRSDLRAALIGLGAHHGAADVARAAFEGLAASVFELAKAVEATAGVPNRVVFTGGFLRESRWVQLMTDALGVATAVPIPDAATSTGAAMIGWAGVEGVPVGEVFTPSLSAVAEPRPAEHLRLRETAERTAAYRRALWP